jgi:hypothetical protein
VPTVSDAALPWVLFVGTLAAGVIGGLLAFALDRYLSRGRDWLGREALRPAHPRRSVRLR